MQDNYSGEVIFMGLVRENDSGDVASVDFAGVYSDRYNWRFPAVPDIGGNWLPFMGDGYPTNVIINLETMEYTFTRAGLMTSSDITQKLDRLLME